MVGFGPAAKRVRKSHRFTGRSVMLVAIEVRVSKPADTLPPNRAPRKPATGARQARQTAISGSG